MKEQTVLHKVGRKPKPHLKIAIDAGSLSAEDEREKGGVSTVTQILINELQKIDLRNQYLLYTYARISNHNRSHNSITYRILPQPGFKTIWLPLAFRFDKPDVFIATSQAIPFNAPPTLLFVYDLAFLKFPECFKNPMRLKRNTKKAVLNARHIVTISEASKQDIVKEYKLKDDSVSVVYPGVGHEYRPQGTRYLGALPYLLFVGPLKKTKNIPVLIDAFAQFLKMSSKKYRLILIGSDKDLDPMIFRTVNKWGINKYVDVRGYVPDSELPKYYRGATLFVSPSLIEGFGLPLLEAMASGIPVIAGNNTSMPEVVGKAGILTDVKNPDSVAQAMFSISQDSSLRKKLITQGIKQARLFDTARFAKEVLNLIYDRVYLLR